MNNLYRKIYKAINEGVVKSLHIDDNTPINYNHSKINNDFDALEYSVNQLLQCNGHNLDAECIAKYNDIIDNLKDEKYVVKNLNELITIHDKLKSLMQFSIAHHPQFFDQGWRWMDTSKALTVITLDNKEISFDNFTKEYIKFICLKTQECGDILIYRNPVSAYSYQWSIDNDLIIDNSKYIENLNDAIYDYDGYKNTYGNKKEISKRLDEFPVYQYIYKESHKQIADKEKKYQAYLPSIGELNIINKSFDLINTILMHINNGSALSERAGYWSSTQVSHNYVYSLYCRNILKTEKTNDVNEILPLYKKIK